MGLRFNVGQLCVDVKLEQMASDFDDIKYASNKVTDWEGKLQNRNGKTTRQSNSTHSVTVYILCTTVVFHLAIVKALETIKELQIAENIPREVTVHTDSRITHQSLKNSNNHKYLVEETRKKKAISLEKHNWKITFTWIQAHVGRPLR